jgi:hypothetical protein
MDMGVYLAIGATVLTLTILPGPHHDLVSLKKLALGVLSLYKWWNLLLMRLRGETQDDIHNRRVCSGEAWDEYCDTLKAAGATVLSAGTPKDPFSQAEGYRYLSRLVRGGLENFMESADVNCPQLVSIANGGRVAPIKLGSDSPDNLYQNASLSSKYTYLVQGSRGTVDCLGTPIPTLCSLDPEAGG